MCRRILMAALVLVLAVPALGQFTYGTTGLLNMPTADMQKDGTVMMGGGYLSKHVTPTRWNYDTWNYYVNITFLPWLEVAYTCTIFDEWASKTVRMMNQDRNFSGRLRLWKEGWWKAWTPQIVVGVNDVTSGSGGDYLNFGVDGSGNGYYNRYYVAVTKHLNLENVGSLGIHASYVYNKRTDYRLNDWAVGGNFRFALKRNDGISKVLNGLNLMVEAYPANGQGGRKIRLNVHEPIRHYARGLHIGRYDLNAGVSYSCWQDRINWYGYYYGCKDFSTGLQLKIYMK